MAIYLFKNNQNVKKTYFERCIERNADDHDLSGHGIGSR